MKRKLEIKYLHENTGQVLGINANPRTQSDSNFKKLVKSLKDTPEMLEYRGLLVYPCGDDFIVIGGNMRLRALKELKIPDVWCEVIDESIDKKK